MPPKPRTPEQLAADKDNILTEAAAIMRKQGLSELTLRELSKRLHMSATNIYNYFHNKDDIYLHIRIKSFQILQGQIESALADETLPLKRLERYIRAYIQFGLEHPGDYQLMFGAANPKAMDYTGTPIEETANMEKRNAMRSFHTLYNILRECLPDADELIVKVKCTRIICEMNGLVDMIHASIVREIEVDFQQVLEDLIQHILLEFSDETIN